MLGKRLNSSRKALIGLEPLIGNVVWGGVAWVAVAGHLHGFLAAILVFKVLNELTVIQYQQGLD